MPIQNHKSTVEHCPRAVHWKCKELEGLNDGQKSGCSFALGDTTYVRLFTISSLPLALHIPPHFSFVSVCFVISLHLRSTPMPIC